jgi:inhibitor of KinA
MHLDSTFKDLPLQFNYLGDHAIVISINTPISSESIQMVKKVVTLCAFIKKTHPWIKEIIPAYQTITLVYDIHAFYQLERTDPLLFIKNIFPSLMKENFLETEAGENKVIKIPVCYDETFGIDLASMATLKNITIEEIIERHTHEIYNVFCLGFMPGFAYMGNVSDKIQVARHLAPRPKVFAGSVGIAGVQTGIYPTNSPGGWQIIGRTPLKIFDPHPEKLALFKAGDQVQFYSINRATYDQMTIS